MEIKKGLTFTGNEKCFQGKVEVLEVDQPNNRLRVQLTLSGSDFNSSWEEEWNLQHTIWGFETGEYFEKEYPSQEDTQEMEAVRLEHGTATVRKGASRELLEALNDLSKRAYETVGNFNEFKTAIYPEASPIIKRHYPLDAHEISPKSK